MSKYAEIIKCLENATGPDHVIDAHILLTMNGLTMHEDSDPSEGVFAYWEKGICYNCSRWEYFTNSIDAAVDLVKRSLPNHTAGVQPGIRGMMWARIYFVSDVEVQCTSEAKAKTAPLAILIAMLRTLEAKESAA